MRVFLFVFSFLSLVSLEEAPNLRQITNHLSVVSRLTTGICIQNDLLENKITRNQVISELESSNVTFGHLEDFSSILESFGKSFLDNHDVVRQRLRILSEFLEKAEFIESASQASLTEEFRTKAAEVTDGKVKIDGIISKDVKLVRFSDFLRLILDESMTEIPTKPDDVFKLKNAILTLSEELEGYKNYITELKDYEKTFVSLFEIESFEMDTILKPVKELTVLAVNYTRSRLVGVETISWMKLLKDQSENVESSKILNSHELMNNLIEELDQLFPLVKNLSTVKLNSKPAHLTKIFETDLTEKWFLEKFAEGEQKYMDKLKSSLTLLQNFVGKMKTVVEEIEEFSSNSSEFKMLSFKRIVLKTQKIIEKMNEFNDASSVISDSLANSIECLETNQIAHSQKPVNLTKFKEVYEFSLDFQKEIIRVHESMKKVLAETEIENFAILDELKTSIIGDEFNMKSNETEVWTLVEEIREFAKDKKIFSAIQETGKIITELSESKLEEMLEEIIDFNVISETQEVFSDTNFTQALSCLKDTNNTVFDASFSFKLMNLVEKVEEMNGNDILETTDILKNVERIKTSLNKLEDSSRKKKRDATESGEKQLLKLDNSKKSVEDLEKGVSVLTNIIEVVDRKEPILASTNFDDKVHNAITSIRIPPMISVWTPQIREKMKKTIEEIEELEKIASESGIKDLQSEFAVLNNATIVNGLILNTKYFKELIPNNLASSKDQEFSENCITDS
uniref:WSN domain-containing protein n=1 Tax=Caenorhabditis tropicalis TaxID=1561998 RepID=A0A1I7UNS4_9PELO